MAKVAGRHMEPWYLGRADKRQMVAGGRAKAHVHLNHLQIVNCGRHQASVPQEVHDRAGGRGGIESLFLHRGAHDEYTVLPGDQVHARSANDVPDQARTAKARAGMATGGCWSMAGAIRCRSQAPWYRCFDS